MEKQIEQKESLSLSDTFVRDFVKETQVLTTYFIHYSDSLNIIQHKYEGIENLQEMSQEERDQIIQLNTSLRQLVRSTYIKYSSFHDILVKKGELKEDSLLENPDEYMFTQIFLARDDLTAYVLEINKFVSSQLLKGLLSRPSDYT